MGYDIIATKNGKRGDVYNVLSLPTLRSHVATGHPSDDADLLLYFFLRDHLDGDTPLGTPGIKYSLFNGSKKILDGSVKGVPKVLGVLDTLSKRRKA